MEIEVRTMIHESYPWKEDLLEMKEQIIGNNCYVELLMPKEKLL